MQIKIGIIGTKEMLRAILAAIKSFPTFLPVPQAVSSDEEMLQAALRLSEETEVLLLPGPREHRIVKEKLRLSLPVHYIPLTDAGLYKALFQAQQSGKLQGVISIDTLTRKMVSRTLKELGLDPNKAVVYDGPAYASPDKLAAFHKLHADTRECTIAFTGSKQAAEQLERLQVEHVQLMPSEQDMIVTLERALLSTESRRSKESQIVVGMVNVDDFGKLALRHRSEHEVQKLKLDIHRMVLGYVESLDGYLMALGGDEYHFFTTRGIFERETGGYKTIPLGKDASKTYGLSLSLGIGFGASAGDAGTNARMALRKAKEAGGNGCFIVREDRSLIGPLEMADPVQAVLTPTDPELIKRAEEAGMTSAYMSKLLANMAKFSISEYKVHDLASLLGITVRSAHRLLLQWMDHGLVDIAGYEKMPKGRPRQIYRFSFLTDQT